MSAKHSVRPAAGSITHADGQRERRLVRGVHRCCIEAARAGAEFLWHVIWAGELLREEQRNTPPRQWKAKLRRLFPDGEGTMSYRTCVEYMRVSAYFQSLDGFPQFGQSPACAKVQRAAQMEFVRATGLESVRQAIGRIAQANRNARRQLMWPDKCAAPIGAEGDLEHDTPRKLHSSESMPPVASALSRFNNHDPTIGEGTKSHLWEEYITPHEIVACVITLLGAIDLDPCGVEDSSLHLPATLTLAPPDDSLSSSQEWSGRIYVHPPFDNVLAFAERAVKAVETNEASEVVLLVPAVTDAKYMTPLQPFVKGFLRDRPTFATSSGELVQPPTPYVVILVSGDPWRADEFATVFDSICHIYYPHRWA